MSCGVAVNLTRLTTSGTFQNTPAKSFSRRCSSYAKSGSLSETNWPTNFVASGEPAILPPMLSPFCQSIPAPTSISNWLSCCEFSVTAGEQSNRCSLRITSLGFLICRKNLTFNWNWQSGNFDAAPAPRLLQRLPISPPDFRRSPRHSAAD